VALKLALKAYGREVGLDVLGVASAAPFLAEKVHLERRQAAGLGPNPFEYPEIAPRVYPDLLLPGVRSIIAAGMSYLMPESSSTGDPLRGWLSRYCRGLDYHTVLECRLKHLACWLEGQVPGVRALVHVDTGAPLDRAIAERAGVGKLGKSTNLIAPRLGTWVFLGEILTDVSLPPDEPSTMRVCGNCTRCIDACPTGCISEWQVDANRCIGYVTQMDGPVPREYREAMGNRLFGCDDCQDVCPYNARPLSGLHPEFAPLPEIGAEPDLLGLLAMSEAEFGRVYGPTAAAWRGLEPLQRNAVLALGNSGAPVAFGPLAETLGHPGPLLRAHAAWGLGRLATLRPALNAAANRALSERLAIEEDPEVRLEIELALVRLSAAEAGQERSGA
jgi:epoxyqueuosine reductase